MSDCGDCKEIEGNGKLSVYLISEKKLKTDDIKRILETKCGFTDFQIKKVFNFINTEGECIIFSGGYTKGVELAQTLANFNINHQVRDERFSK